MTKTSDVVVAFLSRIGERDRYDVLLYDADPDAVPSSRDLSSLARRVPELAKAGTLVDHAPAEVAFSKLQELVGVYLEGEGSAARIGSLLQMKVPFLDELRGRDRRIWLYFEARELEELPWELLADQPSRRTVYYRGSPTRAVPAFELEDGPRVLFLHDDTPSSRELCQELSSHSHGQVRPATVESFEQARSFDVVQVVAWSQVGSGFESVLQLAGGSHLVASELGRILFGGRTGLLLLSPPPFEAPERTAESCRAYMHFSQENLQCSIVAPVGPLLEPRRFWIPFHSALTGTASVEEAMVAGRTDVANVPVVFFLRHHTPRVFRRLGPGGVHTLGGTRSGRGHREPVAKMAARRDNLRSMLEALENIDAHSAPSRSSGPDDVLRAAREELDGLEAELGRISGDDE